MRMPKLHSQVFLFVLVGAMCNILHASTPPAPTPRQASAQQGSATTPLQNASADEKLSLSDQIIQDVLEPLRAGTETQNIRQILSAFDKREVTDYHDLEQQFH